ncbi:hypothetical protein QYF36_001300 [Acer negundo]|nr:hypothetical protein QYF36_001300 [Acer negundo]
MRGKFNTALKGSFLLACFSNQQKKILTFSCLPTGFFSFSTTSKSFKVIDCVMERHGNCQRRRLKRTNGGGGWWWGCRNAVSSVFRRIGRCMFVTSYPVVQCFALDDCRHHHHHHKHFY